MARSAEGGICDQCIVEEFFPTSAIEERIMDAAVPRGHRFSPWRTHHLNL